MRKIACIIYLLCFAVTACSVGRPGVILKQSDATRAQGTLSPRAEVPQTKVKTAQTFDWVAWDLAHCEVKWNQYCDWQWTLEANPEGYDACKPIWGGVSAGKGGPTWAVELVDYNTVRYRIYAAGSWKVYDQWGSHLRVENVGMKLITRGASAADRKAAGCVEAGWHN